MDIPFKSDFVWDEKKCEYVNEKSELVVSRDECGIRVVLDNDADPNSRPDILIEKRTGNRWTVFIHPFGGDVGVAIQIEKEKMTVEDDVGKKIFTWQ